MHWCVAGSLTSQPLVVRESDAPYADHINSLLVGAGVSLAVVVVFAVVPGAILIARSRSWSEAWFPETPTTAEIPLSVLYSVGLLLLGLHFGVSGLAGLLGGIAQVVSSDTSWSLSSGWRSLAASSVSFAAGVGLFVAGRRRASHAA